MLPTFYIVYLSEKILIYIFSFILTRELTFFIHVQIFNIYHIIQRENLDSLYRTKSCYVNHQGRGKTLLLMLKRFILSQRQSGIF